MIDGKLKNLGLHKDEEVAAAVRKEAAEKHYKEFINLNFQKQTYYE